MSCSVIAIPWAIAWVVGTIAATGFMAVEEEISEAEDKEKVHVSSTSDACDEVYVISEKEFLEKSFETPFIDKELLLKTLEEHGVVEIKENKYGQISGISGNFVLTFERMQSDKPYSVLIKYLSTDNVSEEVQNLNEEYAVNVQEAAYMELVENLKNNNMEIESEEVCEDNTIVLTINLE